MSCCVMICYVRLFLSSSLRLKTRVGIRTTAPEVLTYNRPVQLARLARTVVVDGGRIRHTQVEDDVFLRFYVLFERFYYE